MAWVINIEQMIDGNVVNHRNVMTLERPEQLKRLEDLGLNLEDGKALLAAIQCELVAQQCERDSKIRALCPGCGKRRRIKDYRSRRVNTVFGQVSVRRARFECRHRGCRAGLEPAATALRGRSTPEFDALRAKLAAHLPYCVARDLVCELLPVSGGIAHTSFRNRTFAVAERIERCLSEAAPSAGTPPATALTLGLDTAYVRGLPGQPTRHLHALVGEVLGDGGLQRCFAGIEQPQSGHTSLIRMHLQQLDYGKQTELTVLTDGEDALRLFARDATDKAITPILEWFHIAMRVQHLKQLARGLSRRVPTHAAATTKIQDELERLHWRLWHGRTDAVDVSIQRLTKSIGAFRRYRAKREMYAAARKLWVMLYELKRYVRSNAHILVNYHRRHRDGQRVSTSTVESAVNYLVNHRMNKSQQMRWSRPGAHRLLQVRAAVINGEFDSLVKGQPAKVVGHHDESLSLAA